MADDDVEVVLKDDEEVKNPETPQKAGEDGPPAADDVSDGVAELQRKLDAEVAAREAAERRASTAEQRAGQAETSAVGSQMAVIQGALDTIKSNREILTKQASAAMAEGDFDKAAEIQAQIAEQAAVKLDLEKGKAALEARGKTQPTSSDDPVERYVANMQPRAAAWIRAHPDYVTDERKNQRLLAQHWAAKAEGHVEGTDNYFNFIEGKLGMRGNGHAQERQAVDEGATRNEPAREEPTSAAAQVVSRRDEVQPSPAPTSRGGSSRRITLTKAEQEAADISGVSYEEYARFRERERKAGTLIYTHNQRRH